MSKGFDERPYPGTHYQKSLVRLTAQDAVRAGARLQAMSLIGKTSRRTRPASSAARRVAYPGRPLRCAPRPMLLHRFSARACRPPRPLRSDVPGIYDSGYRYGQVEARRARHKSPRPCGFRSGGRPVRRRTRPMLKHRPSCGSCRICSPDLNRMIQFKSDRL